MLRFIASGGMGEVYEAEDLELRQTVALKTVHPRDSRQNLAVERFKREIHLARKVTHPNVCRIYDVGYHSWTNGESIIFLSMELLAGETLAARLKRDSPMSTAEALPLVAQMVDALAAAHAAGVVHRDFKSENIFLVPEGAASRVVVTDFGVARGVEYDEFAAGVTVADAAVGTPAYMAPEQLEGTAITPAIDQYALGVVIFEMVTGTLPFAGDTPIATAVKRLSQPAPSPLTIVPGLDPRWVEVIQRCLARNASERFSTVSGVKSLLHSVSAHESARTSVLPSQTDPDRARPFSSSPRRSRQLWLLVGLAVALAVALVQAVVRIRTALESPLGGAGEARRAVAVVPFGNVAAREEFDWLSVALAEMVASELRAGEGLRTIPGDAVARAILDLAIGAGEEIPAEKLARFKSRLGADFVVTGSFAVLGSTPTANVRLAVRAEDAWKHELLGESVESGGEQELFDLVSRVGARLRQLLGGAERRSRASAGDATPRSPRAAKLYSEALLDLRAFKPQAALDRLELAKAAEPSSPMIRAALANSWAALGYRGRAEKEANEALSLGQNLPPEERLVVDALVAELRQDWPRAVEIYGKLWTAFPDNLDFGLRLGRAQLDGGRTDLALSTFASLRELPPPDRDNPQIDLAEAAAALAASDFKRQREAASRAAEKAKEMAAPLLVAEARVSEAEALRRLGAPLEAESAANEARALYAAAGDRVGVAAALSISASALFDRGELSASRAANSEALQSYREAGDRMGVARTLNGIAVLARQQGNLGAARQLYSEALTVLADIDDRRGTAYTRNNLAATSAEEGRLAEAKTEVEGALAAFRELADPSGTADALLNLGAIELQVGDLALARTHLEEALRFKRELGLRGGEASVLFTLGAIARERGQVADATRRFEEASRLAEETANRAISANILQAEGELALDQAEGSRARALLEAALALRTEIGRPGKIDESRTALARMALEAGQPRAALASLTSLPGQESTYRTTELTIRRALIRARASAALGRTVDARTALDQALLLLAESENLPLRFEASAALLTLALAGSKVAIPEDAELTATVSDARTRGYEQSALELEILQGRVDRRRNRAGAAGRLAALAIECDRRGLARLSQLARAGEGS